MVARGYEVKTWLGFSAKGGGFRNASYLIAADRQMTQSEVREAFVRCRDETNAALDSVTPLLPYVDGSVLNLLKLPGVNLLVLPLVPVVLANESRVASQSQPIVERTFPPCMARNGLRTTTVRFGKESREASATPSTPGDQESTTSPAVAAEPTASAPSEPPATSVTAAVPAKPSTPPGALNWPPVGASYVLSVRTSGSFGAGVKTRKVTYLGEQTWQGSTVRAFSDGSITTYVDDKRRMLARVNSVSRAPIETYEPYFVFADWPLRTGKWWPNRYRYSDHEWGRTSNNAQYDGEVEAYENVKTPAGTFRCFRIALGGGTAKTVLWYSGELGLVVKTRNERFSSHYRGPGVSETELVSYDFKP
jgi:hypothetical protein